MKEEGVWSELRIPQGFDHSNINIVRPILFSSPSLPHIVRACSHVLFTNRVSFSVGSIYEWFESWTNYYPPFGLGLVGDGLF